MVHYSRQKVTKEGVAAWYNLLTKSGLYDEQRPERDVLGIGVFLCASDAPRFPSRASGPENPFVAVFAQLVIQDDAELRTHAPRLSQTVQTEPLPLPARDVLAQVLKLWFFARFRGLTAKVIWAMLNLLTPIHETRTNQSIFADGEVIAETRGKAIGKAGVLNRQLSRRFRALPSWAEGRLQAALIAQLDGLRGGSFEAARVEALIAPRLDCASRMVNDAAQCFRHTRPQCGTGVVASDGFGYYISAQHARYRKPRLLLDCVDFWAVGLLR